MRLKSVALDLIFLILTIPLVLLLFRIVPDRKTAATFAGFVFVGLPIVMMIRRFKNPLPTKNARRLWWAGVLQFWILFALPILGARLLFWETPFEQFTFFGFSGDQWHSLSTKSYTVMAVCVLVSGLLRDTKK